MSMSVIAAFDTILDHFPAGRAWGHLGVVEITLGGLGTFPAACQKQVVKSGRHIASIWEPLGSVVAPLAAMGRPFAD